MAAAKPPETPKEENELCGIVMPISAIDGCPPEHWIDVRTILESAIETAGYVPNLVSNADHIGVIQQRIVQNLHNNPMCVCDVSGRNPNVMFELGMRLTFDKPTIVIKDDKTPFSFDTSIIEHLEYPRDLRFATIVAFKEKLAEKIRATAAYFMRDPEASSFLKHFGNFKASKLETTEVPALELVMKEFASLRHLVSAARPKEGSPYDISKSIGTSLMISISVSGAGVMSKILDHLVKRGDMVGSLKKSETTTEVLLSPLINPDRAIDLCEELEKRFPGTNVEPKFLADVKSHPLSNLF